MSARERDLIDELANGYRAAQILFAANQLRLFDALGRESLTSGEIAARLGTDPRATRILCDALVAIALLRKRQDRYLNSNEALDALVDDAPHPRRAILAHHAGLLKRWSSLAEVVRTGGPVAPTSGGGMAQTVRDPKAFAAAMADIGRQSAAETVRTLDLRHCRTLLDAGGGPGIYSIAFATRNPELRVTLMDNAETLDVAADNLAAAGLADRVDRRPGDVLTDDLGGPYDVIFMSNLIHSMSEAECLRLVQRAAAALSAGGRLCIKDFVLNEDRVSPADAAIFAVNMLVNTPAGDCYSLAQINDWYRQAGLKPAEVRAVGAFSRIAIAVRP